MCRSSRVAVPLVLLLASSTLPGCDVHLLIVTGPSPAGSIVVISNPSSVSAQPVTGATCPAAQPFLVQFRLTVRESRGMDLYLREVRLRFVDRFGVTGLDILLTEADLGRQFDSTLITAHGTRDFPFSPRFGCGADRVGVFYLHVRIVDANGSDQSFDLQITVN